MDPITVEITVHRIGGTDELQERTWGPWNASLCHGEERTVLQGRYMPHIPLCVHTSKWAMAMPGWRGFTLGLSDIQGRPIGPRQVPGLLYEQLSDIQSFTNVFDPLHGMFTVGMRKAYPVEWPAQAAEGDA